MTFSKAEALQDSREKGWSLAKNLQADVDVMKEALETIANGTHEEHLTADGIARAALNQVAWHKENT